MPVDVDDIDEPIEPVVIELAELIVVVFEPLAVVGELPELDALPPAALVVVVESSHADAVATTARAERERHKRRVDFMPWT